jgi:integration host factor subunit beta
MAEEPLTITKKDLVNRISDRTGTTKVIVKDILQLFLDEIIDELAKGHRLEFREFGVFEVRDRAARKAQNPRTLEKVAVPARRVVKFKVGRTMREKVCDEPAPAPKPEKHKLPAPSARVEPAIQKPKPPAPPPSNSPF